MRKKKYQLNPPVTSDIKSPKNEVNTPSQEPSTVLISKSILHSRLQPASNTQPSQQQSSPFQQTLSPHYEGPITNGLVQFNHKIVKKNTDQPTFNLKMTALFKVLYKTEGYRMLSILVHIIYIFGVLIEQPQQIFQQESDDSFRCDLSFYLQAVCLAIMVPVLLIKQLRMVGFDYFRILFEIMSFTSGILALWGPSYILQYAKALRCSRILFLVRETNLIVPSYNMLTSLKSIKNVLCPAILFVYIYAIIGLYSFSGNEYSRCRDPGVLHTQGNWTAYSKAMYFCGQRSCPRDNNIQYECLNPIDFGVTPNQQQFSGIQFGNGLLKYSNIFMAFMTTYKQTLITGSSRVILLQKQAMNFIFVLVYYYSFIYLISYIYLNIFYGLMIVNRQNHISTKEEYEALAERQNGTQVCEAEKELIKSYKRIFTRINKTIFFPTALVHTQHNLNPHIYQTVQDYTQDELINEKRSGMQLNQDILSAAAAEHEVTKQIIKIAELKIKNGPEIKQELISFPNKVLNTLKSLYYYFNIAVVILGCVNVCMEHAGQSLEWQKLMNFLDLVFFGLYFLDFFGRYLLIVSRTDQRQLVVKLPQMIYIDGIVLSICMTGYLYEMLISDDLTDFYIAETKIQKCFRAMLYLRIIVVLSFEPYFAESRKLFRFAWQAVKKSANFMLLWLLVLIMFSLMGYFLFGNCNTTDGCYLKTNAQATYHGIFQAIITIAVIMYNEDWDYIMYEQFPEHGFFIVVWNLIIITFGLLIISKYFMTYLLSELDTRINSNFDKENEEKVQQKSFVENLIKQAIQEEESIQSEVSLISTPQNKQNYEKNSIKRSSTDSNLSNQRRSSRKQPQKRVAFNNSVAPSDEFLIKDLSNLKINRKQINIRRTKTKRQAERVVVPNKIRDSVRKTLTGNEDKSGSMSGSQRSKQEKIQNEPESEQIHENLATKYPKSKPYMIIKSIAILIVIFNFMFYLPQADPNLPVKKISHYSSIAVDCFFIIDMVGQIYIYGLVTFAKNASASQWIDCILNIISIIYFTPLGTNYIVKQVYSFRCLRIGYWVNLRCETSESMRVTAIGFTQLVPKLINLLMMICIVYGFFANIIVRIYKDEMWECVNFESSAQITTKIDCFNYGGDWIEENMNASNFGNALLYIFLLASTQDWLNTMNYLSTIQGTDLQPQSSTSSFLRISFLIFMFFANIIVINIFVGVCINNFKQIKKKLTGEADLSKDEKEWLNIKNQIYLLQPEPMDQEPQNQIRRMFFHIAKGKKIIVFKFVQLIGLMILLSFVTTNMSESYKNKILLGQYIFTLCGFITFLIELIANGVKNHNRTMRIFEIIVYLYAISYGIIIITTNLPNSIHKICGGLFVTLQLVIQEFQFFQKMFNSLLTILPKTKDIFMLMIITLFIFTCLGMEIFGYLKPGQQLNEFDQNYVNFGNALFSLIKFSTWQEPINQIRDGIQKMTANSVCFEVNDYASFLAYGQNGCGNTALALTFFITFHIVYSLILMPTLMGVIFDSYNEVYIDESACINKFQLRKVKEEWKKFDPEGTGYISYRDFWVLISQIIKIYNFGHNKLLNNETRQNFLKELNISIYESPEGILCFQFHELIEALSRIILVRKQKSLKRKQIFKKEVTYIHEVNKKSEILHKLKKSCYDSSHVLTLILLKSGLKSWRSKATGENKGSLFQKIEMKSIIKRE